MINKNEFKIFYQAVNILDNIYQDGAQDAIELIQSFGATDFDEEDFRFCIEYFGVLKIKYSAEKNSFLIPRLIRGENRPSGQEVLSKIYDSIKLRWGR